MRPSVRRRTEGATADIGQPVGGDEHVSGDKYLRFDNHHSDVCGRYTTSSLTSPTEKGPGKPGPIDRPIIDRAEHQQHQPTDAQLPRQSFAGAVGRSGCANLYIPERRTEEPASETSPPHSNRNFGPIGGGCVAEGMFESMA